MHAVDKRAPCQSVPPASTSAQSIESVSRMARSCAALLLGLVVATTLCSSATASVLPGERGRRLLDGAVGDVLKQAMDLDIVFDLTALVETLTAGKVTLLQKDGKTASVALHPGQKAELTAENVMLDDGGLVLHIQFLGVDKVVILDLAKLESVLLGQKLMVVVVFVVDEVKKVLHLRSPDGSFVQADIGFSA